MQECFGQSGAVTEWLQHVPWQHMVTLEFPWHIKPKAALGHVDSYLNEVERAARARVGSFHVVETRSVHGDPVQPHIHALLASPKALDAAELSAMWLDHVGHSNNAAYRDRVNALPFDPGGNEILYVSKCLDYPGAVWDTRHLDFFLPDSEIHSRMDHRSIRSLRRFAAAASRS